MCLGSLHFQNWLCLVVSLVVLQDGQVSFEMYLHQISSPPSGGPFSGGEGWSIVNFFEMFSSYWSDQHFLRGYLDRDHLFYFVCERSHV